MAVTTSTLISASSYNSIRSVIYSVINTEYGFTSSNPTSANNVSAGSISTLQDWYNLYYDVTKCIIHQTNNLVPNLPEPTSTSVLTANFYNTLESAASTAYTNRYNVHPSQLASTTNSDTRTVSWNSTIEYRVDYQWESSSVLEKFFKLGGYIKADSLSYANSSGSSDDLNWISLIGTANSALASSSNYYQYSDIASTKTVTAASNANGSIQVIYDRNGDGRTINVYVRLNVTAVSSMTLDVTASLTHYTSSGSLGPSPYGVPAVTPSTQTYSFNTGGVSGQSPTRTLSVSPTSLSFSFPAGQTSSAQTITLTNNGNSTLSISTITYATNISATPVFAYSWGSIPSTTISAGSNKTFTLAYNCSAETNINTVLGIVSDNDGGTVNIPVGISVSAPVFQYTLNPDSWVATTTDYNPIVQSFNIVTSGYALGSYVAGLSNTTGFSLDSSSSTGPRVLFDPSSLTSATYVTSLTVTATSVISTVAVKTATISINYISLQNINLGSWISAPAADNSIVGISYDIIGGDRYITVGLGTGAEGSPRLAETGGINPAGQSSFATLSALNFNGDIGYKNGTALYLPYQPLGSWSTFLNDYGAWIRYQSTEPANANVTRSYKFTLNAAATVNWTFSVDRYGYFSIDGILCGDMQEPYYQTPYAETQSGSVFLSAGDHVLTFVALGYSTSRAIAIRLVANNQEIWSTRTPVRKKLVGATIVEQPPYLYWNEVYRIPVPNTGVPVRYNSADYCVKNSSDANSENYGYYFGQQGGATDHSLVVVDNDGFGNISIAMNTRYLSGNSSVDTTNFNTTYAFYYYEALSSVNRYSQLETPTSSDTRYFLGFDSNGQVRTSLVPYPRTTGGGGGCPAPWHKILLTDGSLIEAGNLKPGMQIRTQHEQTLEWGDFAVTAVDIENHPRVEIVFEHINFVCSLTHKFYNKNDNWIQAFELKPGMTVNGYKVVDVNKYDLGEVVKIMVDQAHTYICEGILSHNLKYDPIWNDLWFFDPNTGTWIRLYAVPV